MNLWIFNCTVLLMLDPISDDEGGNIRPVAQPPKKSSQQDLYMRLGLLLGDSAKVGSRCSPHSHDSISSLASLEATTLASTNTSPVSTLTGELVVVLEVVAITFEV